MFGRGHVIRTLERQLKAKDDQIKRLTELVAGQAGVPVDRPMFPPMVNDPYVNRDPDAIQDPEQAVYADNY